MRFPIHKELSACWFIGYKEFCSLVEFEADGLSLNYLGQLKSLDVQTFTRFGYDIEKERCYFAVGMIPKGGKPINFGAGEVSNFTGIVAYNMVVERDGSKHYVFPNNAGRMKSFIEDELNVHKGDGITFAAAIRGTLDISGFAEVRNMYFGFDRGPSVVADGELYVPLSVSSMINGKPDKKIGEVVIMYSHPERYFSFTVTLDRIDVVLAAVSGSLGFEFSPNLFGVYIGYPETLAGNIGIFRLGMGLGFRIDSKEGMLIKAKMELGLEKNIKVAIVYLSGYLYAGADGAMYFNPMPNGFELTLYLKGGIKGGIDVGKKFDIIKLYLDARGTISMIPPSTAWELKCSAKVGYSLNLFLFSYNGEVSASFNTSIKK